MPHAIPGVTETEEQSEVCKTIESRARWKAREVKRKM